VPVCQVGGDSLICTLGILGHFIGEHPENMNVEGEHSSLHLAAAGARHASGRAFVGSGT